MTGRKLIFQGRSWPAAEAEPTPVPQNILLADGTLLSQRNFVRLISRGNGRVWTPEIVDGSWRDLSELDLADPAACQTFARRIGDPVGALGMSRPAGYTQDRPHGGGPPRTRFYPAVPGSVSTGQWLPVASALQLLAQAWDAPDARGISCVNGTNRRVLLQDFLAQLAVQTALKELRVIASDGTLADTTTRLDTFLIMQAANALARALSMRRCIQCESWFEIRRPKSEPRFCSASCRALYHQ